MTCLNESSEGNSLEEYVYGSVRIQAMPVGEKGNRGNSVRYQGGMNCCCFSCCS